MKDFACTGFGLDTSFVLSKEGGALQPWFNGIRLLVGGHNRDDTVYFGAHSEEVEGGGDGPWRMLSLYSLLLCPVLLGLY